MTRYRNGMLRLTLGRWAAVMIGAAALLFAWAVRHGQFDDLDTPALDILRDEVPPSRGAADASAAPTAPGSRPCSGDIALYRWVKPRMPASRPARACS